ncbi:MAG: DUF4395 domain-containing protein [Patescibacteria group bacterium]|nr:DUF4395 domain-containing protein [Patescibacteria group bacterium]
MSFKNIFQFGETVTGYNIPVLNEREARAAAGVLLMISAVAFSHAMFTQNAVIIKMAIIIFFVDFAIRVLVNPKYAPSMILGRIAVQNQIPEYTGAPQKKFAWSLGLGLAVVMMLIIVVIGQINAIACLLCILCLALLFFETSFGICIGCKMYNMIYKDKAQHCPGQSCELQTKEEIQKIHSSQITILAITILGFIALAQLIPSGTLAFGHETTPEHTIESNTGCLLSTPEPSIIENCFTGGCGR